MTLDRPWDGGLPPAGWPGPFPPTAGRDPRSVEPTADARSMADQVFTQYAAFIQAGFAADQALVLVGSFMTAVIMSGAAQQEGDGGG